MGAASPGSRVVGIDVGGPKKGFHAVALADGAYLARFKSRDPEAVVAWCQCEIAADVIAVDAPCAWSADGHARPAERALMQQGIWCFSTPTRAKALAHPSDYYGWMLRGEALYRALAPGHPCCAVWPPAAPPYCLETFPHAIAWHLRGGDANARQKRAQRAALLRDAGIDLGPAPGIDTIDAALCALVAHRAATGQPCAAVGEPNTGYIIVPTILL